MSVNRVQRTRSVEYKISFLQRRREIYIYVGRHWVGRIISAANDPLHARRGGYGVYVQLPGMWGPVARRPDIVQAKSAAIEYLQMWLAGFVEEPTDPEERAEKEPVVMVRISRTRPAPAPVVRSRIRR